LWSFANSATILMIRKPPIFCLEISLEITDCSRMLQI